jgi:DNA-directed RNA polymerase specialized sigma24 family protein
MLLKCSRPDLVFDDENAVKLLSLHNPEQDVEWKELLFKLRQAVSDLPDQCRSIFRLVNEEGFRIGDSV